MTRRKLFMVFVAAPLVPAAASRTKQLVRKLIRNTEYGRFGRASTDVSPKGVHDFMWISREWNAARAQDATQAKWEAYCKYVRAVDPDFRFPEGYEQLWWKDLQRRPVGHPHYRLPESALEV